MGWNKGCTVEKCSASLVPRKGKWDRSSNGIMSDPSGDGKHGSTSVLDLNKTATVGDLEAKWVVSQIASQATRLKSWSNRLSILDITISVSQFVNLNSSNSTKHLYETRCRNSVDSVSRSHGGKVSELDALSDREVLVWRNLVKGESELVEGESNSSNHGRTPVLEFSSLDESSSSFRSPFKSDLVPVGLTEELWVSDKGGGTEARNLLSDFKERDFGHGQCLVDSTRLGRHKGGGGGEADDG